MDHSSQKNHTSKWQKWISYGEIHRKTWIVIYLKSTDGGKSLKNPSAMTGLSCCKMTTTQRQIVYFRIARGLLFLYTKEQAHHLSKLIWATLP